MRIQRFIHPSSLHVPEKQIDLAQVNLNFSYEKGRASEEKNKKKYGMRQRESSKMGRKKREAEEICTGKTESSSIHAKMPHHVHIHHYHSSG